MRSVADHSTIAEPDITLVLNRDGIIENATLSAAIGDEKIDSWLGRSWSDVVGEAAGDKVKRIIEDASNTGVSAFRQITQRFPSGLELPFEYTAVRLGDKGSLVAVGKNLKAVAELQSRLIAAQQLMERDYWRLREVEGRYRLLFDASSEAVLLVSATTMQILDANPAASRVMDLPAMKRGRPLDRDFLSLLPERERPALLAMLARVRDMGRTPGIVVRMGPNNETWIVRASLMGADAGSEFVLQFTPAGANTKDFERQVPISVEALIERAPDAFLIIDRNGLIQRVNRAFLDLVGAGARGSVIGEPVSRWLSQPGADAHTLLANVERHHFVRLFQTVLVSERGVETPVEISAAGDSESGSKFICLIVRDVARRLPVSEQSSELGEMLRVIADRIGKAPLRQVVQDTVEIVENHHIKAALESSGGNRTAAAEILGLSRQSLYAKLNRYDLESDD
jgi:transcriptional regulator PpsR